MNIKNFLIACAALCALSGSTAFAQNVVSGVYVGGHIRRQRPKTITTLRNSGFTYVILFNVHVEPDGTLTTDGETIVKDGTYVFQNTQPYYQQDVADLMTPPTSIQMLEICIGGWGNTSYENIKNLINKEGTGKTSTLYKNFKAFKEALPEITAVNNDDEHCYDANTASQFHIMMYDLGFRTTMAPYTYQSFWTSFSDKIRAKRRLAVIRSMIQCYDGGAGNDPRNWNFTGVVRRHAGRTNYQSSMETSIAQMENWKKTGAASGGFVWVYNDETWNLNQWASAMNRTFGAMSVDEDSVIVKCYSESNYKGYCVDLPLGEYTQADLALYGLAAQDLSSIQVVREGYYIRLYKSTNLTGSRRLVQRDVRSLGAYDNQICSIEIVPNPNYTGVTDVGETEEIKFANGGVTVRHAKGQTLSLYNSAGQIVFSKPIGSHDETISLPSLPHDVYVIRTPRRQLKVVL